MQEEYADRSSKEGSRSPLAMFAVAGAIAASIAGCSSAPFRPPETVGEAPSARTAPPAARRGGGYYKDDGPGDDIPDNLDSIPDAEPRNEPLHRFANRPYNVFGVNYVPATQHTPFRQRGMASWYGRRFHGNPTSSGEAYDMYGMTAAHPTLPIPSYARVTRLENGRSVIVRINDRGPFHKSRIIDLSYAAAHRLGYVNSGSAMVEVEAIQPDEDGSVAFARPLAPPAGEAGGFAPGAAAPVAAASSSSSASPPAESLESTPLAPLAPAMPPSAVPPVTAGPAPTPEAGRVAAGAPALAVRPASEAERGVFLQLGAFSSHANARDFAGALRAQLAALADRLELLDDGGRYRLHLGPFASSEEARAEADRLASLLKFRPFVVLR